MSLLAKTSTLPLENLHTTMYRRREESHGGRTQRCDSSRHRQETPPKPCVPWQPRLSNHTKTRQEFSKEHLCLRNAERAASVEQEGTPNRRGHMPLEPIIVSRGSNSAGMQNSHGVNHQHPKVCKHMAHAASATNARALTWLLPLTPSSPRASGSPGFNHRNPQVHKPLGHLASTTKNRNSTSPR